MGSVSLPARARWLCDVQAKRKTLRVSQTSEAMLKALHTTHLARHLAFPAKSDNSKIARGLDLESVPNDRAWLRMARELVGFFVC